MSGMLFYKDALTEGCWRHSSAVIDYGARIGKDSKIWHFSHVRASAQIGARVTIGQGCYIEGTIADDVAIQNGVSVYNGVYIHRGAFIGPNVVFTNDQFPRAGNRAFETVATSVGERASIGAGAVIRCGVSIGEFAMVACGAVVTQLVLPFALVKGNPARHDGWVCSMGHPMTLVGTIGHDTRFRCERCGDALDVLVRRPAGGVRRESADRVPVDAG